MSLRSKWTQFKEKLIGDTDPSAIMNDLIRTVVSAWPSLTLASVSAVIDIALRKHPALCLPPHS